MSQTEVQLIKSSSVVDADIVGMSSSKLSGALPAISGASLTNLPSSGISDSDQWRITTTVISNSLFLTSNWERVDSGGYGLLGTGMTESSGVFTFPSTGIYRIDFQAAGYRGTADSIRFVNAYIMTTTDNSSYSEASYGVTNIHNATNCYGSMTISHQFDVTNVSTHKVKFKVESENDLIWMGNSGTTQTGAVFTRLGDT
tara:strand:- start:275 stop:874 length:600 start_codon:yes stop_codon:yes gene_type:complete